MPVWVVMGNDFPDSVFDNSEAAERHCDSKRDGHETHARRIYWRVYKFQLRTE